MFRSANSIAARRQPALLEQLDERRLFSIAVVSGVLTVNGTSGGETLYVAWNQTSSTTWSAKVSDGSTVEQWNWSGNNSWNAVSLYGGAGNDTLYAAYNLAGWTNTTFPPVATALNGGVGNDLIVGSERADFLLGGSNDDDIYGYGGNDEIRGESGSDEVIAGAGNDLVDGGDGADTLSGNGGADAIYAGRSDGGLYSSASQDGYVDQVFGNALAAGDDFALDTLVASTGYDGDYKFEY